MKISILTCSAAMAETNVIKSFLNWQHQKYDIIDDAKLMLTTTSGHLYPVINIDTARGLVKIIGFKAMYKFFETNGLFLAN